MHATLQVACKYAHNCQIMAQTQECHYYSSTPKTVPFQISGCKILSCK